VFISLNTINRVVFMVGSGLFITRRNLLVNIVYSLGSKELNKLDLNEITCS
jgi:hypothetical protein